MRALELAMGSSRITNAADVGGGRGEWTTQLCPHAENVYLLDYSPPDSRRMPANVISTQADLNARWPLPDESIEFAFALEVIEHLENPRHFFRELARIVQPGGYAFVSTPNNHSLASKLTFLLRGQHRLFQEQCYPGHISPLLLCDFVRICAEAGFSINYVIWSDHDTLPRLHWPMPFGGKWFSDSVGLIMRRALPR